MNDRSRRDAGLSDALGAVLLISVVALGITVASIAIISSPVPQKVPAISVDVFNTSDTVFIRHSGGDTLARGEYRILADDVDRTSEFLMQGVQPARWSLGDTLEYPVASPNDIPGSIKIVAFNGRSEQVILQVQLLPPTLAPTHTVSPSVSPSASVSPTTQEPAPVADFSGSPLSGTRPLTVQFTDRSSNSPTSWSWNFGDGGSSVSQNPSYTYLTTGTYTVTLTVTNAGGSDTETKTGYITVTDVAPVAEFNGTPLSGTRPLVVQFTDMSANSPTSWSWDFGDGGASTIRNASHTYTAAGTYAVSLTVSNAGGSDTETKAGYITVSNPPTSIVKYVLMYAQTASASRRNTPVPGFDPIPDGAVILPSQYNNEPITIRAITDPLPTGSVRLVLSGAGSRIQTENIDPYCLFGDDPQWSYNPWIPSPPVYGTYQLTGTPYTGTAGSGTAGPPLTINFTLSAPPTMTPTPTPVLPPVANFNGVPPAGSAPLTVTFTDLSTNSPTSWSWNFGDGGTSSQQNPTHTYAFSGTYSVTMTATNAGGSDSETKTGYITVNVPLVANFDWDESGSSRNVDFTDTSTGTPSSWSWNFGDGAASTEQNPRHRYSSGGSYPVRLNITRSSDGATSSITQTVTV